MGQGIQINGWRCKEETFRESPRKDNFLIHKLSKKIGCDLSDSELVADCFKRLVIEPHVSINRNNKNDVELIEECESYVKDQILMSNFAERKITTTYVDAGVDLTSLVSTIQEKFQAFSNPL